VPLQRDTDGVKCIIKEDLVWWNIYLDERSCVMKNLVRKKI